MASDRDLVSKEEHELNYLLTKWEKKQSIANRDILANVIDDFKADDSYSPHNREVFYQYVDDNDVISKFE